MVTQLFFQCLIHNTCQLFDYIVLLPTVGIFCTDLLVHSGISVWLLNAFIVLYSGPFIFKIQKNRMIKVHVQGILENLTRGWPSICNWNPHDLVLSHAQPLVMFIQDSGNHCRPNLCLCYKPQQHSTLHRHQVQTRVLTALAAK